MKILISGATGFIGKYLVKRLLNDHHQLVVIGRSEIKIKKIFGETVQSAAWSDLDLLLADEFDCVINLAGENISNKLWTDKVKSKILNSRVEATEKLANWCLKSLGKKIHLYNTSAVGIYGSKVNEVLSESALIARSEAGEFLCQVAQSWEKATQVASAQGVNVTIMRFAVVLDKHEAMLKKLLPSFKLGFGSILGCGSQFISWIDIDDLVEAIVFLLKHPELTGPINLCSPRPVTQQEFAEQLALMLNRPLWLHLPAGLVKIIFGQMGSELLLGSQNIYPQRLLTAGFQFSYPEIRESLRHQLIKE